MNDFAERPSELHRGTNGRRARNKDTIAATHEDRILLASIGASISIFQATNDPGLAHLMSEDICWQFAHEQWQDARPRRWERARWHEWVDEGAWVESKRVRVERLARDLGLRFTAGPRTHRGNGLWRLLRKVLWF